PGIFRQRGRQKLDRYPATHELVLAQIDDAHTAGAELFEQLVLADNEAAPLAAQQLVRLKVSEDAVLDERRSELFRLFGQRHDAAELLQLRLQAFRFDKAAFAQERQNIC